MVDLSRNCKLEDILTTKHLLNLATKHQMKWRIPSLGRHIPESYQCTCLSISSKTVPTVFLFNKFLLSFRPRQFCRGLKSIRASAIGYCVGNKIIDLGSVGCGLNNASVCFNSLIMYFPLCFFLPRSECI